MAAAAVGCAVCVGVGCADGAAQAAQLKQALLLLMWSVAAAVAAAVLPSVSQPFP